jgi:malate dehydrogenase (oxaloacetate-decarboxylating)
MIRVSHTSRSFLSIPRSSALYTTQTRLLATMGSDKFAHLPRATSGPQPCSLTGKALLSDGQLSKGSAFPSHERREFGLQGLLPSRVQSLEAQVSRAYDQYHEKTTDIGKNTFMTSLKAQNETLYYKVIQTHLKEMMPIIYTPTEGSAIANYSRLFRGPEGVFLTIDQVGEIEADLDQVAKSKQADDVDIIVVSDGEQILGIGDQGVGGVLISIAKLVLYTLCAGIHPNRTLPVVLDCGTDNEELLEDEHYLGLQKPRVRGEEYDAFVDRFVQAARKRFPKAYIHFEDFGVHNARRILDKYSGKIPCFNDDVQGTGCVTLAAVTAAASVADVKIGDLRCVMYGAGTAGTGIADQIADAIALDSGKSKEDAKKQIYCIDQQGVVLESMGDDLNYAQKPYARPDDEWKDADSKSLLAVVKQVKPHVLIGTSTQPGAFTKEVVQEMSKHIERPMIFPLSNPTKLHEAKPADLFEWSDGKVLTATGSPFDPVEVKGGKKREIAECNNSVVFPGIGLGTVLSRAKLITTAMLVEATKALASQAPAMKDPDAALLPDVEDVGEVSVKIAAAVIKQAIKEGVAQEEDIPETQEDLEEWIRVQMWKPEYRPLKKVE